MQVYSDRFETTLPKKHFDPPKPPVFQKPSAWSLLAVGVLVGGTLVGALMPRPQPVAPVTAIVAPTPPPPLPDSRITNYGQDVGRLPSGGERIPQVNNYAPRARLVHIRPIGTFENDRMPDGRVLSTTYRGELSGAASLPTYGANLGDMWYTQNDGHCWVLAPIGTGSSTVGWVDP